MNLDHNINNEDADLSGMAPKLSKLKANNPFSPSDIYFDELASKLQNRIDDLEEIKDNAPTLSNINKYNPFEVPKDYFEELPSIIQNQVIESNCRSSRFEWLALLIKPRFAFPMITIIFITIGAINFMNENAEVKNDTNSEELSLEDHLYYINETEIIEQLTAEANIDEENVTDENSIENYLLDNTIDDTNLNNEL